ncbi:hypothetical protein [Deinococcus sp. RM]|uniref:hypothetical protein n=1 Tax=Deinococcus sp. RM TaxID=2316359 RepID=UPI0011C23F4E|nr:hypothetical protein [Deinococcus sp. RM]
MLSTKAKELKSATYKKSQQGKLKAGTERNNHELTPVLIREVQQGIYEFPQRGVLLVREQENWQFVDYTPKRIRINPPFDSKTYKLDMGNVASIFMIPETMPDKRKIIDGKLFHFVESIQFEDEQIGSEDVLVNAEREISLDTSQSNKNHGKLDGFDSKLSRLNSLNDLLMKGIISEEEFQHLKSRIIDSM